MTWDDLVKENGFHPEYGKRYECVIKGCDSGREQKILLDCVDEDDVFWRTADDGSELSNAWDVIRWVEVKP